MTNTTSNLDPKEKTISSTPTSRSKFSISIPSHTTNELMAQVPPRTPTHSLKSPNGSHSSDSILGINGAKLRRRRRRSTSSTDQGATLEGSQVDIEPDRNPKKRSDADPVDYPRKRATVACEICRGRKSRCDGAKPRCRLCTELNADCIYREPGIKLDAGDKLILEHLNRIEGLIQNNIVARSDGTPLDGHSPATSSGTALSREDVFPESIGTLDYSMAALPVIDLGTWFGSQHPTNISAMPEAHTTSALHLLQWPIIRDLVSRPYGPQKLLQLELAREPLHLATSLSLDLSNTVVYVQAFFERVNVWYACVNPYSWTSLYRTALSHGFREGPESCIVLLVMALGSASLGGSISNVSKDNEPPGIQYFTAAWGLIPGLMTRIDTLSTQCLILATSMKLQLLLGKQGKIPSHSKELCKRVYWNALLFESDLLAELDLPHSGIVDLEETVGLPGGFKEEDDESPGSDELWYFLAEIALRRLLNRVSHTVYSKGSMTSIDALEPLTAELDFQLTQWYEGLPLALQFPHAYIPLSNPVQTVLRLRYFACRTIIFRPYLLAVLENELAIFDPAVRDNCLKCLEACVRQLEHVKAHHAGHLPYLWQGALSIVSQALLVMGATMNHSLAILLPPAQQIDGIINDVVVEIERYAHLAPSLRLSSEIIREAEGRRIVFLKSVGLRV